MRDFHQNYLYIYHNYFLLPKNLMARRLLWFSFSEKQEIRLVQAYKFNPGFQSDGEP